MYLIPKDLNSKLKISRHIYIKQFFLAVLGLGIVLIFDNLIMPNLKIFYYVFSFFAIAFLILPAKNNPEKYNYEAIYYALTRKRNVFHSISIVETMDQTEIEKLTNPTDEKTDCDKHVITENKGINTNKHLAHGSIVTCKNKMYYIKNIEDSKLEAFKIVDGLQLIRVKNAMKIKFLEQEKSLSLDKIYYLNVEKIKMVNGQLDGEAIKNIDNNIEFLKQAGILRYNTK